MAMLISFELRFNWKLTRVFFVLAFLDFYQVANAVASSNPSSSGATSDISFCSRVDCHYYASCLNCQFPANCKYGSNVLVNCTTNKLCLNQFTIQRETRCQYCWQTDNNQHDCEVHRNCSTSSLKLHRTVCRMDENIICKGRRTFFKNTRCNWTNGYSWWKAMFLSVTLGGFGVDRFYLGLWKSAIGKLFSFGGLGIWTVVDIILIGVGYVGPADGSCFI